MGRLLVVVVALAAVVGGLVWLSFPADPVSPLAPDAGIEEAAPARPRDVVLEESAITAPDQLAGDLREVATGWSSIATDPTRPIIGVVVFPEGTPADERLEVVLQAIPHPKEGPDLRLLFGDWDEVARVAVEADGSFEFPRPIGVAYMQVDVDGEYLLLGWPLEIKDPDATVRLEPMLGAHVTFVLVPPVGTAYDPSVLIGREVTLSHTPRAWNFSGTAPTVTFEVRSDLTLVGRALAVDRSYEVERPYSMASERVGVLPYVVIDDWDPVLTGGTRERFEIPLVDGQVVAGTVVDSAGKPLAGVDVTASCKTGGATRNYGAKTDEHGAFRFHGLHSGLAALSAKTPGLLSASLKGGDLGAGRERSGLRLVLQAGASLRGRLQLPDGRGVPGVQIEARIAPGDRYSECFQACTDGDGRFELTGLQDKKFVMGAEARIDLDSGAIQVGDRRSTAPLYRADPIEHHAGGGSVLLVMHPAQPLPGFRMDK